MKTIWNIELDPLCTVFVTFNNGSSPSFIDDPVSLVLTNDSFIVNGKESKSYFPREYIKSFDVSYTTRYRYEF